MTDVIASEVAGEVAGHEVSILFVCMGNICRSPTAEGVLRQQLQQRGWAERVRVDSAGTHAYHVGSPPDERSQAHARRRGYELAALRARVLEADDFAAFDLILTMDEHNLERARARCPAALRHKIEPVAQYFRHSRLTEVPDPYYGGADGFQAVLDLLEDAAQGLLAALEPRLSRGTQLSASCRPPSGAAQP
jgi:protein-tyrosine phosphatase